MIASSVPGMTPRRSCSSSIPSLHRSPPVVAGDVRPNDFDDGGRASTFRGRNPQQLLNGRSRLIQASPKRWQGWKWWRILVTRDGFGPFRSRSFTVDRPRTVLVVDDEEDVVSLMRDFLEAEGYRVLAAGDGAAALDVLRDTPVDCLLLDVMMPGQSGFDVLRKI